MNGDSDDHRLFKLNMLMGILGFHKHPDHFNAPFSKPSEHIIYLDVNGNGVDFRFNWAKERVSVVFNRLFTKSWSTFDDLLPEISECVNEWMMRPDNCPVTSQSVKPRRSIKAADIVRDIRHGLERNSVRHKVMPQPDNPCLR